MFKNELVSFKKNILGICIMAFASIFTSIGQYFWKLSLGTDIIYVVIGFVLYALGAVLMILAFKYGSFSVVHPILSLSYVIALFIGINLLNESVNSYQFLGIASIIAGVILIGGGDD